MLVKGYLVEVKGNSFKFIAQRPKLTIYQLCYLRQVT